MIARYAAVLFSDEEGFRLLGEAAEARPSLGRCVFGICPASGNQNDLVIRRHSAKRLKSIEFHLGGAWPPIATQ
jgi:hypothetical protein